MPPELRVPDNKNIYASFTQSEYNVIKARIRSFWNNYGEAGDEWDPDKLSEMACESQLVIGVIAQKLGIKPLRKKKQ